MSSNSVPGSCFCGAVTFEIDMPTAFCGHCHCTMCRRPHGASFVTWTAVPPKQFRITGGGDQLQIYQSSEHGRRQFCKTCGSQMFCWHDTEDSMKAELIDVALASLHGDIDRMPEEHYYYDSKASWTVVDDDLPKLGGDSGNEPL
ncbi:MAG: ribulose phosphate epimerase [Thiotrichales bacterium]|nr:ribulose phosphate epimerase [Thiotrichales bacterium]|tara:strand:+ start:597 stop:1031 length:435 start_codon:yes stop_codon:yes gene_type:complete